MVSYSLRSKYYNNRLDLDMFIAKSDASNAWKCIIKNKSLILKGSRMTIDNREKVLFHYNRWCSEKPLRDLVFEPIPVDLQGLTINEFQIPGVGWHWEQF